MSVALPQSATASSRAASPAGMASATKAKKETATTTAKALFPWSKASVPFVKKMKPPKRHAKTAGPGMPREPRMGILRC